MIQDIERLNLPKGKWQEYARELLDKPFFIHTKDGAYYNAKALNIICIYPDLRTIEFIIEHVARFKLSFLYGCKAILVSHDTFIEPDCRGKGLAGVLQLIKERIAKDLAVKLLIATAVETNEPQQRVLKRWNWDAITKFTNPRTQHVVGFFIKHLD